MAKQRKTFSVGDRVAYSAGWIKSVGGHAFAQLRGTVKETAKFGEVQLVTIAWDNYFAASDYHDDGLGRVIAPNLTLVSRIGIDSALNT